jgi:hypothetical protein
MARLEDLMAALASIEQGRAENASQYRWSPAHYA